MKKIVLGIVCAGLFFAATAAVSAFDGVDPSHSCFGLQTRVFALISQYWADNNALHDQGKEPDSTYAQATRELADTLVKAVQEQDQATLRFIGDIYKSLPEAARTPLQPALSRAQSTLAMNDMQGRQIERLREYFPGYGYGEPGFKYRKGMELKREAKGTTWRDEEHTYTTSKELNLTVSVNLQSLLSKWLTGGLIGNLSMGEPYRPSFTGGYNGGYGGSSGTGFVVDVSFTTSTSITTKARRKYEVNRIWFELLRAPKTAWGSNAEWNLCGQTYELIQDPTGDEFVVEMSPAVTPENSSGDENASYEAAE